MTHELCPDELHRLKPMSPRSLSCFLREDAEMRDRDRAHSLPECLKPNDPYSVVGGPGRLRCTRTMPPRKTSISRELNGNVCRRWTAIQDVYENADSETSKPQTRIEKSIILSVQNLIERDKLKGHVPMISTPVTPEIVGRSTAAPLLTFLLGPFRHD